MSASGTSTASMLPSENGLIPGGLSQPGPSVPYAKEKRKISSLPGSWSQEKVERKLEC